MFTTLLSCSSDEYLTPRLNFFSLSVQIWFASPQSAKARRPFFRIISNVLPPVYSHINEESKSNQKPGTRQDSNPQLLNHEAHAPPHFYNLAQVTQNVATMVLEPNFQNFQL